jgi:hypothetical protein
MLNPLFAQWKTNELSNLRKKKITTTLSTIKIDNFSIVPNSFYIVESNIGKYTLNEAESILIWSKKPDQDSVTVVYRVFPFALKMKFFQYKYDSVRNNFIAEKPLKIKNAVSGNDIPLFDFKGLQSEGSIGRSISFGNNQDAVLNSSLNLQLHGMIGDSMEITASITDNSIPIQPDGNTRDLRDFDRIFLQVKKKNWHLDFGDLDLKENQSPYVSFSKRIQGVSFFNSAKLNSKITNDVFLSGSIAKGKYTRNVIKPIERNQGPYRLQGANNELYFMVLAGTEKVYIDGILLTRGEDQDYVINYNTAELTFTPKQIITKDKRIQIEFEYADRNYLNTQFYVSNQWEIKNKLKLNFAAYSNSDQKTSPIDQPLSISQQNFLKNIGDSVQNAFISLASRDTFSNGKILYKKIDTIYNNGLHDSVFVFSRDINEALYNVSFTYVGAGNGNYKTLPNGANGKVFQWVKPDAFMRKQGDYLPVSYLITPKQQQVYAVGLQYNISKNTSIQTDVALSNYDINLYSNLDKENNKGLAGKVNVKHQLNPIEFLKSKHVIEFNGGFEWVQKYFRPIERLRSIEFLRDWSLNTDATSANEKLVNGSIKLSGNKGGNVQYAFVMYNRDENYRAYKNQLKVQSQLKYFTVSSNSSLMQLNDVNKTGYFFSPNIEIKNQFKKFHETEVGLSFSAEINKIKNTIADTFTFGSFSFSRIEAFLRSDPQNKNNWSINYFTRHDWLPFNQIWTKMDKSDNLGFTINLLKNEQRQLKTTAGYRSLQVLNGGANNQKSDKSFLARFEYGFNEWDGLLKGDAFYELGSGQEQKRAFTYVAVPIGQGLYTWNDYNNNGIEELNEFELGVFQDQKKYIRIFTPSNEYVKTNFLQFNYNVEFIPKQLIHSNKKSLLKILKRSSLNSSWQINKKITDLKLIVFNPFGNGFADTSLIAGSSVLTNSLLINRTSALWGLDITQTNTSAQALLTYGAEKRLSNRWQGKLRLQLNRTLSMQVNGNQELQSLLTGGAAFQNRNYQIVQNKIEPSFIYQYKSIFRANIGYRYTQKNNKIDLMESLKEQSFNAEMKYNASSKMSAGLKMTYSEIKFSGTESFNSTVGFIMLGGLLPGKNYLWSIDFIRKLSGNLELNIQYEGRKSGTSNTINIGRASVRAIF